MLFIVFQEDHSPGDARFLGCVSGIRPALANRNRDLVAYGDDLVITAFWGRSPTENNRLSFRHDGTLPMIGVWYRDGGSLYTIVCPD